MKIVNKLFLIFILGSICIFSSNTTYADSFSSNHISLKNNKKATIEK